MRDKKLEVLAERRLGRRWKLPEGAEIEELPAAAAKPWDEPPQNEPPQARTGSDGFVRLLESRAEELLEEAGSRGPDGFSPQAGLEREVRLLLWRLELARKRRGRNVERLEGRDLELRSLLLQIERHPPTFGLGAEQRTLEKLEVLELERERIEREAEDALAFLLEKLLAACERLELLGGALSSSDHGKRG